MPQYIEVNGEVVEFPDGMSDEEIARAITGGSQEPPPSPSVAAPKEKEEEYNWLERNLDFPAGIAGAVAGAKIGSVAGPQGALVGGIVGGGIGTFSGSVASDLYTNTEVDFEGATKDALVGMGIDVATLKLGRFIPQDVFARTMQRLGVSPEQAAKKIVAKAGTPESLQQTQEMLTAGGASLTTFQTGQATSAQKFFERLGNLGIGSQFVMRDNVEKVNMIIKEEFDKAFNINSAVDASHLGQQLTETLELGKNALSDIYVQGLDNISSKLGTGATSPAPLQARIDQLLRGSKITGKAIDEETGEIINKTVGSTFSDATVQFLQKQQAALQDIFSLDGKALIELEKNITKKQKELSTVGSPLYNPQAAAELLRIQGELKGVYGNLLSKIDKKAASEYLALKQDYASGLNSLLPEINATVVKRASEKGSFTGLGNVVIKTGTKDQVAALMSSIDKAYALAAKNGTLDAMQYGSAKEAKQAIRTSFISENFPHILDDGLDPSKFIKKIRSLNTPTQEAKLKILFGEQYPQLRKLMNAIEETSTGASGDLGQLMLRSQEYGAVKSLGAVIAGGTAAGIAQGLSVGGVAAAVLMTPYVFAKMATNPKHVNRMLGLTKGKFADLRTKAEYASILANDIIKTMTPPERMELGEYLQTAAGLNQIEQQDDEYQSVLPDNAVIGF